MNRAAICLSLATGVVLFAACGEKPGNGNQNNNSEPMCGNNVAEGIETCDLADLNAQTCQSQGWSGGTLACTTGCQLDFSGCDTPPSCGDGTIQAPEQCDGAALGNQTCHLQGWLGGTLGCGTNCSYDVSGCWDSGGGCGDRQIQAPEQCDDTNLNSQTCQTQGFDDGTLACDASCMFDTTGCRGCGDGAINGSEACDGAELGTATCQIQGFDGGTLVCTNACSFDTSGCYRCGDGTKNGAEECDGNDFGTSTCTNKGHASGSLSCSGTCTIVATGCYTCGDGALDGPEACDGTNLDSETCGSQTATLSEGALACAAGCLAFDPSVCHLCGNGVAEDPEACDTSDFSGATCQSEAGLPDGSLACSGACTTIDTAGCHDCGNGSIEGPEVCDGSDTSGATCMGEVGLPDGTVACAPTCLALDTTDCHNCGNGTLEGAEECDGDEYVDSCISLGYGTGAIGCNASCTLDTSACVTCTWTWQAINSTGPGEPRATERHAAVWMPQYGKMLVKGGRPSFNSYGSMYDPVADDWENTTGWGCCDYPTLVWTGSLALLFPGGSYYDPFTDTGGSGNPDVDEPIVTSGHSAVWTGTEMIVWGGGGGTNYGARWDPVLDTWTRTSQGANCPTPKVWHAAIWTGTEMIIWGGNITNTGGRYDPATDTWQPTSTGSNCPSSREGLLHSTVWTGSRMIVWGGSGFSEHDTGGLYDPIADSWETTSMGPNLPHARGTHTAIWTGSEVIVWGGSYIQGANDIVLNDGAQYDPFTDSWRPTVMTNAPTPRRLHTAVWTGSEMIVWSGMDDSSGTPVYRDDGARYYCAP